MKHTDIYGREWNYTPGHDTARMLQVNSNMLLMVYMFSYKLRAYDPDYEPAYANGWPTDVVDCYLLQGALMDDGAHYWHVGIRLSDEGSDYISPYIPQCFIRALIDQHKGRCSFKEYQAVDKLTTEKDREVI